MEVLIRFLIITGIVLPLVPDEAFGPFGVLRPRDIWRMVVLISGLSFVGYVLMRVGASARSYLLSGLLGGLVSSTATALAYARAARDAATPRRYEALVILGASTAFVRIAIVLGVVAPVLLLRVAPVLIVMLAVGLALGFLAHRAAPQAVEPHVYSNPLSMKAALAFAGIYALVLFLSAAAGEYFAEAGTYAVTGLAAMVGADAPTLSLARLATGGQVGFEPAAWGISMVAIMATLGKVGVVLLTGRGEFVRRVSLALVVMAVAGTAVLSQL
ncbi:MAG: DUF4010 domain-containing protein, partial [Myxococcota bacterium]